MEIQHAVDAEQITKASVEIGSKVPDFKLLDADGYEHMLSHYQGSKVMLCFYRYGYCPIAAMSFGRLMGAHKKLAWASKLKVNVNMHICKT